MPRARDLFVDTSGWGYHLDRKDPLHTGVEIVYIDRAIDDRAWALLEARDDKNSMPLYLHLVRLQSTQSFTANEGIS
jgi:hypothetical protein